jgi:dihydroxyacetone kinase-like protein
MRTEDLNIVVRRALADLVGYADELRDLDQALGDGDLGVTISLGAGAVIEALEQLPEETTAAELAKACAKAFANANPSTMAALVAGGLLAGSKTFVDCTEPTLADGARFVRAAGDNIALRGKTQLGDKTILDAIMPAVDALEGATDTAAALDEAVAGAERAVFDTKALQSRRGRASWLQERSIGLQDPGATAFLRLLQCWQAALRAPAGSN